MRKLLLVLFCAVLFGTSASAQKKFSVYAIGFYNVENLFDTTHDEGKTTTISRRLVVISGTK